MGRELYDRCPSCEGTARGSDCERCDGVGFVPIGLTLEMLDQLHRQAQELIHQAVSLDRALQGRRNDRLSGQPGRDRNRPPL
jgi:hypothetical protein